MCTMLCVGESGKDAGDGRGGVHVLLAATLCCPSAPLLRTFSRYFQPRIRSTRTSIQPYLL